MKLSLYIVIVFYKNIPYICQKNYKYLKYTVNIVKQNLLINNI